MQPLNPFLGAFFKSTLPSQCVPIQNHILLVPTTESLLTAYDHDSGTPYTELASTEEFLGSHVLRIQADHGMVDNKDIPNMRDVRGKAKQYITLNGRTIIIKDNFAYSNKGFKSLSQAQVLHDVLWYPDTLEPRAWLVYYISRPLVGVWNEAKIIPAVLPTIGATPAVNVAGPEQSSPSEAAITVPRKKDVKTFGDLLNHFPLIARQMQPGLDRLFKEFGGIFEKPLPPPPSAASIPDPQPDGPITKAVRHARSYSITSQPTFENTGNVAGAIAEDFYAEDDEAIMRGALETAVTAAVDLFQMVDKSQLSLLGASTDLTGPVVERLVERYIAEQVHDAILFPKLCALRRPEDLDLESKIRQMEFVDISQVGIAIQGGQQGKHELTIRIGKAVEEFRKLNVAGSPQQMMDVLLKTLQTVTQLTSDASSGPARTSEKSSIVLTINADTLVSLLLVIVIRAQVRYLQARLSYMRHFIFIDDVESGEMGYALSTFEAVLSYLARDSSSLRKASRRNKKLWQATTKGDVREMRAILEPTKADIEDDSDVPGEDPAPWNQTNGHSKSCSSTSLSRRISQASTLDHVFPFQTQLAEQPDAKGATLRRPKTVTMDTRSMSSNSTFSFRSRATTIDSTSSGIEGDTSIERLSRTEDSAGESVLMMALQHERKESLQYLLSLTEYYPAAVVLEDVNNEKTTLFSAAVQLGQKQIIEVLLNYLVYNVAQPDLLAYFAIQDTRGRSVSHYLFNAPELISRIGSLMLWRQKDHNGQTPLFALCRSYDHINYQAMVEAALNAATTSQNDGGPLHLDEHVDGKGNTLLHITSNPQLANQMVFNCDSDVNATNDKKFTALMVASKYGRVDMVRALFRDPRADLNARELRGLTAVELAKDDEVRNRIDDLCLFSGKASEDGRITAVVRSFFVEDATIRLVLKSGMPTDNHSFTITTCRRSLADFENLAKLLAIENPASWLPSISGSRSPFQIPSRPSRAVLRDIQYRLDGFLKILLAHPTFATHEMLWEFFLVPDIQADMMERRSMLKAESRAEKVRDEFEPIEDVKNVEQFVDHARDMVRSSNYATKNMIRRTNALRLATLDLFEAGSNASRHFAALAFVPQAHTSAIISFFLTLHVPSTPPITTFHTSLIQLHSTLIALLLSLSRPTQLISSIQTSSKTLTRSYDSLSRSTRWPLGLLDDTRLRMDREKEEKVKKVEVEREDLGRELRYTQQIVAGELAGWQEWKARVVKSAIRDLARGMIVQERARLEGLKRAMRKLRTDVPEEASLVANLHESTSEADSIPMTAISKPGLEDGP